METSTQSSEVSAIIESEANLSKGTPKLALDLMAGSIAGITSTFFGHPLDTIKVRMQVLGHRFWFCIKNMIKQEGVLSLYKGVQSPLLSAPLTTAMSFGSYEVSKAILGVEKGKKVSFIQGTLSGGLAGFFYSGISTPVELIKCRQQMEGTGLNSKNSGCLRMTVNILKTEGVAGLYKGFWITCLRDIPAGGIQFGCYELFRNFLNRNSPDQSLSNLIAGGLARFTTWFCCYPQDLIKTRIQCKTGYQGIYECCQEVFATYGSKGFWKGSLPSILRTFVSGGISFAVYEEAKKTLYSL